MPQLGLFDNDDYLVPDLSDEQALLLRLVRARRGATAALSVADLAAAAAIPERRVQQQVKHLVEQHAQPIGTSTVPPYGYYWIETDTERRAVRDGLVHRALSILRRARAYDRSGWVARLVGQAEMDLGGGPCSGT